MSDIQVAIQGVIESLNVLKNALDEAPTQEGGKGKGKKRSGKKTRGGGDCEMAEYPFPGGEVAPSPAIAPMLTPSPATPPALAAPITTGGKKGKKGSSKSKRGGNCGLTAAPYPWEEPTKGGNKPRGGDCSGNTWF